MDTVPVRVRRDKEVDELVSGAIGRIIDFGSIVAIVLAVALVVNVNLSGLSASLFGSSAKPAAPAFSKAASPRWNSAAASSNLPPAAAATHQPSSAYSFFADVFSQQHIAGADSRAQAKKRAQEPTEESPKSTNVQKQQQQRPTTAPVERVQAADTDKPTKQSSKKETTWMNYAIAIFPAVKEMIGEIAPGKLESDAERVLAEAGESAWNVVTNIMSEMAVNLDDEKANVPEPRKTSPKAKKAQQTKPKRDKKPQTELTLESVKNYLAADNGVAEKKPSLTVESPFSDPNLLEVFGELQQAAYNHGKKLAEVVLSQIEENADIFGPQFVSETKTSKKKQQIASPRKPQEKKEDGVKQAAEALYKLFEGDSAETRKNPGNTAAQDFFVNQGWEPSQKQASAPLSEYFASIAKNVRNKIATVQKADSKPSPEGSFFVDDLQDSFGQVFGSAEGIQIPDMQAWKSVLPLISELFIHQETESSSSRGSNDASKPATRASDSMLTLEKLAKFFTDSGAVKVENSGQPALREQQQQQQQVAATIQDKAKMVEAMIEQVVSKFMTAQDTNRNPEKSVGGSSVLVDDLAEFAETPKLSSNQAFRKFLCNNALGKLISKLGVPQTSGPIKNTQRRWEADPVFVEDLAQIVKGKSSCYGSSFQNYFAGNPVVEDTLKKIMTPQEKSDERPDSSSVFVNDIAGLVVSPLNVKPEWTGLQKFVESAFKDVFDTQRTETSKANNDVMVDDLKSQFKLPLSGSEDSKEKLKKLIETIFSQVDNQRPAGSEAWSTLGDGKLSLESLIGKADKAQWEGFKSALSHVFLI